MHKVKIHEAKTQLSRLIQEALNGQEVIISRGNHPLVKLTPLPGTQCKRRLGGAKEKIKISDDFCEPLEDFKDYM